MKKSILLLLAGVWSLALFGAGRPLNLTIGGERAVLAEGHPRLILTDARMAELRARHTTDTLLQRYVNDVLRATDTMVSLKPLERIMTTRDMLRVSRDALARIYNLAFAWRWTGDERYAEAAEANLAAVCRFVDWDPHHFLDVAEMTHAVAIGYDWLYDRLDDRMRELLRRAIIEMGLEEGLKVYRAKSGFHKRVNNWNQGCNSGLIIGALAVADTDPDYARRILPTALESMPRAMTAFDPDGVCVEGPSYWHYAVRYCAYGFASMRSALGTDFGMSERFEGFRKTGYFPITMTGPAEYMLAFSDCRMKVRRACLPPMFWLATRYDNPDFSESEHDLLRHMPAQVYHVMYYTPRVAGWRAKASLDKYLRSKVEVACMRSGWEREALFVGMKAGTTDVSHVHLDMGNFELDALGERWLLDLGSDKYELPGFFDFKKQRWDYYRCVTRSHNLPVFDGREQCLDSKARFERVSLDTEAPFVVANLNEPYRDRCAAVTRGIRLVGGRKAVLVQDEFEMRAPGEVNWGVMTDAAIETEGGTARLTIGGRRLTARILAPAGASFVVESARQAPPQAENAGINRLTIRLKGQTRQRIAVLFSPVWDEGETTSAEVLPLAEWK